MSFLKQLLTPFIEFDEDKKKEQQQGSKPSAAPIQPPVPPPIPNTPPPIDENAQHPLVTGKGSTTTPNQPPAAQIPTFSPSGTLSGPLPEHEEYFEKLIEDHNARNPLFQGTDFKEFVDSKVDIDDIQDEALKYQTAYNILKGSGLTKEKLLSTGQEYMNLIGRDLNAFQSAQALQYKKEVGQKDQLIQKKAEELQALSQKMNALKSEINQLSQEVNLTKDKLNTTKNSFLLAGENKQKEIQTELQKIAKYF
ncbi:hypothetical protein GXP67_24835 [Rhodocytophaga rosea]|uniref:Uncharacterized protein n=1 Tax=Rhodocytophaga rosea TaxID=2704465 RepID=A0A6C0GPV7_9BACT|nr:hypothetical protein [Rhodocytophaga rosea]QHT69643.1 hypothetical protein GXP67_24835 [Rhodocytophaga rosea]